MGSNMSNMNAQPRERRSFRHIEMEHYQSRAAGEKGLTELDNLVLAFKGIQVKPPTDPDSFFVIAGCHGEPFRGAGLSSSQSWGGYCSHGQILFPTWHRAHCLRLEDALRKVEGCENVTLPFLDWCDDETRMSGPPNTFNLQKFELADGTRIDNPLYSYRFQKGIFDNVGTDEPNYIKPKGYETVRYPLSGLVGCAKDYEETEKHNRMYEYPNNIKPLQMNVKDWLGHSITVDGKIIPTGVYHRFKRCLEVPYYTLFSNTSAQHYNQETSNSLSPKDPFFISLESPHNAMHLALGGFDVPKAPNRSTIRGANGDMGENDTAAFDPIFFFHHAFIDRMFWLWQRIHRQTEKLIVEPEFERYPGTNSSDMQGPSAGMRPDVWLTLETPLEPFKKRDDGDPLTSEDVVDIEKQLGYSYGPGSFLDLLTCDGAKGPLESAKPPSTVFAIDNINRGAIRGSFIVATWAKINGEKQLVGCEPILSRRNVSGCANCQAHLPVKAFVPLHGVSAAAYDDAEAGSSVVDQPTDNQLQLHLYRLSTDQLLLL